MPRALAELLIEACTDGDPAKVATLLGRGAPANAVSETGTTALYAAALQPDAAVVRLLLDAGASPNDESAGDVEGTPLCAAGCWGHDDVVMELLAHGADPNQREDGGRGYSPLLWASRHGHEETIRLLLDAGADPNGDLGGEHPLLAAAFSGCLAAVRLLLSHGADARVADENGRSPLQIAEAWADRDIEDGLRRRAAAIGGDETYCRREPRSEGTELIVVGVRSADGSGAEFQQETGHRQIAALLRSIGA
jgi:uncharacterized protein